MPVIDFVNMIYVIHMNKFPSMNPKFFCVSVESLFPILFFGRTYIKINSNKLNFLLLI